MSLFARAPEIVAKRRQELMKDAATAVYRELPGGPLHVHCFFPDDHDRLVSPRLLTVFFHGGMWDTPMVTQFAPQCLHFASRGAVAMAVETRLASTQNTGPMEALEDARALLEWIVQFHGELKIDPAKVVLGGSAGGSFLALHQALKPCVDEPLPPLNPAALLLFSGLYDTLQPSIASRFPSKKVARKLSPLRRMRRNAPPMIMFQGQKDRIMSFDSAVKFYRGMRRRRNRVELVDYVQADHTFFNFNVSAFYYDLTIRAADRFLAGLGLLEPDVDEPMIE